MNLKEFLKPNLEKIILLLIIFTFLPWPRQIYITPGFFISFLFYGPITLAEILSIPLQLGTRYGSPIAIFGKLFGSQMLLTYLNFIMVVVLSYLSSCFISYKTLFLKPTKTKAIISFSILAITSTGLLILFLDGYNEKALGFNIIFPLIIFSIVYVIYSLIEKRK